jgi:eukaryotic-like serine/threonine-protein kinase
VERIARAEDAMGRHQSLMEVDPLFLPPGTLVGPWRVLGWRGRGSYGSIYRAERVGREWAGPFALKVAVHPRDERFRREGWLLSHIHSPYVPGLVDQGVLEHPSGAFPYLVMQWVDGEPLYDWAERRNPTSRQVLRLLAQVARALQATHEVRGLHRDVKGDNLLVRPTDGHVFLMDFGAGHYRGAATITKTLLPPGTTAYQSPESWAFLRVFRRHPTVHYPASTCDDLFAMGVMAYRLVADEYPPPTDPDEPGSEVWSEQGPGPRPPRELNPRVSPELDALIRRLLAVAPVERFDGRAEKTVRALERAGEGAGPEADAPLFGWGQAHRPRRRSPEAVRAIEEMDAAERQEHARQEFEEQAQEAADSKHVHPQPRVRVWGTEMMVAVLGLLFAGLIVAWTHQRHAENHVAAEAGAQEGDVVAVGDSTSAAPAPTLAPVVTNTRNRRIGSPMPEKPFPDQRTPPCTRHGETEIRGGCWYALRDATPPCKEDAYEWKGACYAPSFPIHRQTTSYPP